MASRLTERDPLSEVLPCFDLNELPRSIAEFEVFEVRFKINAGREAVVYRIKRNHRVVNTIKAFTINLEDRIS